jgi:hypothetical protein
LIACSGQDKHGAISIITHGIQTSELHASRPEWKGVYRLWNLKASSSPSHDVPCLIASSILDTRLLCAKSGHIKDITSTSSIEFDTETVHANTISIRGYNLLLQIYPNGLSIIDIGSQGNLSKEFFYIQYNNDNVFNVGSACILAQWRPKDEEEYRIELATSWQQGEYFYIALCIMKQNLCTLQVLNAADASESNIPR